MKILITNDDGILSPSLPLLAKWAQKHAEVVVVAPKYEQSGKSHAINFSGKIEIKKIDILDGVRAYSVDSTPADCVRYAYLGLGEKFDLVISGINKGYNLGRDIVYSGTAGAMFEAARLGMRGVALSTEYRAFENCITDTDSILDNLFELFKTKSLFDECNLYNINIPPIGKEVRFTRLGRIYFTDRFIEKEKDIYVQEGEPVTYDTKDPDSDIDAVEEGFISITPITYERTDLSVLNKLKNL